MNNLEVADINPLEIYTLTLKYNGDIIIAIGHFKVHNTENLISPKLIIMDYPSYIKSSYIRISSILNIRESTQDEIIMFQATIDPVEAFKDILELIPVKNIKDTYILKLKRNYYNISAVGIIFLENAANNYGGIITYLDAENDVLISRFWRLYNNNLHLEYFPWLKCDFKTIELFEDSPKKYKFLLDVQRALSIK